MEVHKKLVNGNEVIEYRINDEDVDINKNNDKLEEYFSFEISKNKQISISYRKIAKFSSMSRFVKMEKLFVKNPLSYEYTYESVKDYLLDESKSDEQKIKYIKRLLKEYFEYYATRQNWHVNVENE